MEATPSAALAPEVAGSAARPPVDPADVAHTFCYIRGKTPTATLKLLKNGQVVYNSMEPHGMWKYTWVEGGIEGRHTPCDGRGEFRVWFNGNPQSSKPAREHVFTQEHGLDVYRLIEVDPAWCVTLIENK